MDCQLYLRAGRQVSTGQSVRRQAVLDRDGRESEPMESRAGQQSVNIVLRFKQILTRGREVHQQRQTGTETETESRGQRHQSRVCVCVSLMDPPPAKRRCTGSVTGLSVATLPAESAQRSAHNRRVESLQDLSAQRVAQSWTYEQVRCALGSVPDPVQSRLRFWSFPCSETELQRYCLLGDGGGWAFRRGGQLADTPGAIRDVQQVGLLLCGSVLDCPQCAPPSPCACAWGQRLRVSLSFARRQLTGAHCSCTGGQYCAHVAALCLWFQRGGRGGTQDRRTPVHSTPPPPHTAAQRTRNEPPDPTAGQRDACWPLDEGQLRETVRRAIDNAIYRPVSKGGLYGVDDRLSALVNMVLEMLRVGDSNAGRVLSVLTGELVRAGRGSRGGAGRSLSLQTAGLWEQIASLWVSVVLNPRAGPGQRTVWLQLLQEWNQDPGAPLQDEGSHITATPAATPVRHSVLFQALQCGSLLAGGVELLCVGDETEPLSVTCARVSALRVNGYLEEAVCLGLQVVRTLRRQRRAPRDAETEEWAGHPLDPIGCLFHTFLEACLMEKDAHPSGGGCMYRHSEGQCLGGSCSLCVAVEVALWGLGEHRVMPRGRDPQERAVQGEESVVAQLRLLSLDAPLLSTLYRESAALLDGRLWSQARGGTLPRHTLVHFLLDALLPHHPELALWLGLTALRVPVLDSALPSADPLLSAGRVSRCFILGHLETRQCELAAALLTMSQGDSVRHQLVLDSVLCHVRSPLLLFRLAQDAVVPPHSPPATPPALALCAEALCRTRGSRSQRRAEMVTWLLDWALRDGLCSLLRVLNSWQSLFTLQEVETLLPPSLSLSSAWGQGGLRTVCDRSAPLRHPALLHAALP
ncbi:zinc finger SWIM domain-containing protein 4 [Amia ocellicauda]|uniref:zinc finger SWIM domain-containing protein 4 n=1 Tax=Amia ocellicauda TaxID=2972642 RepID=UPI003463C4A8